MLDDLIKEALELSTQIRNQYAESSSYINKLDPEMQDFDKVLDKFKNDDKNSVQLRFLANAIELVLAAMMSREHDHMTTEHLTLQLALNNEKIIVNIVDELRQLRQLPLPSESSKKIDEIAAKINEIDKSTKKLKQYEPTLKKFKEALSNTEKVLRDNR